MRSHEVVVFDRVIVVVEHDDGTFELPEEVARFSGFNIALKPAHEPIVVARKPLDRTVAENVLKWGTGAIHVDACRVRYRSAVDEEESKTKNQHSDFDSGPRENRGVYGEDSRDRANYDAAGRWPPNVVLVHDHRCRRVGERRVATSVAVHRHGTTGGDKVALGAALGRFDEGTPDQTYADADGTETVAAFSCAPGCPVFELDRQSGERPSTLTGREDPRKRHDLPRAASPSGYSGGLLPAAVYADSGGASRFFPTFEWSAELDTPEHAPHVPDDLGLAAPFLYCGKASTEEREDGCEALPPRERAVVGQKRCARCGRQAVNVSGACACPDPVWVEAAKHSPRKNHHATVKPVALMRWLVKLATPPGGVVLDPFAGSGTTLVAARLEGFRAIGFEREAEYVEVARGRVLRATQQRTLFDGAVPASARPAEEPTAPTPTQTTGPAPQLSLFDPGGRTT
jgi:hypothetical protein